MSTVPSWLRFLPLALRQRIEQSKGLQQILANAGWLFGDKFLRMGVGLLVGVWVARYLGPEQFGLLNFAMAFIGLFSAMSTLGLQGIVVHEVVNDPAATDEVLGTAFVLQLFGGVVALALVVICIYWLRAEDSSSRIVVALLGLTLVMKATDVAKYWFESKVQSKYTVLVENGVFVAVAVIKVALVLSGASLMAFVWATLAEATAVAVGLLIAYQRKAGSLASWRASRERAASLLGSSWPLMLGGLATMVYMRIDQIMLGQMLNDGEVGIYSAAVRVSEIWYFIPYAVAASIFPHLVATKRHDEKKVQENFQNLYDLMVVMSMLIAVPMSILASPIIGLLYGNEFASASNVLIIHVWATVFVFLSAASGKWFIMNNLQKQLFYRTVMGAVTNIVMNLLMIPKYGAVGAAIATVLSLFFSGFILNYFMKSTRTIFHMQLRSLTFARYYKNIF